MDALIRVLAISGLFILPFLYLSLRKHKNKTKKLPPEPPGGLPIFGHLYEFSKETHLVKTLATMAEKIGPVFIIRLGLPRVLGVSSWEAVKDCFTTNDKAFAGRPNICAGVYLGYDNAALAFTNGAFWRKMRKMVVVELLSTTKLDKWKHIWISEMNFSVKQLYRSVTKNRKVEVDMEEWIGSVNLNFISKILARKRYNYSVEHGFDNKDAVVMRQAFKDFMTLTGEFSSADAFRFRIFHWLDIEGIVRSMKKVFDVMDVILDDWVDEHVRRGRGELPAGEDPDFIDIMMKVVDEEFLAGTDYTRDMIIKATAVTMLQDAAETAVSNMVWIMAMLLNHKDVTKRIQEEIDAKVGRERWVEDSDTDNLVYLQAVVKECMRLYPVVPFIVPHEAIEDCEIWPEPEKFKPERFLTESVPDGVARQFGWMPFGLGRRSCPGYAYALRMTHFIFARLLQGFDFATPSDMPVDMSEGPGITMPKAKPIKALLTPRLPAAIYESYD
ncbi:xanthotoxin 5-hydroxylase CYP82C4-like [Ipomoea triloba]|uniref:xanthotoxin 5-hydroxylase CYP82C4-like n=1 Tax=Ipomoea triloba TaxID=35885 RepID=UPI00125E0FDD|nr:xanthotoxin 5-hydroxylase CYP82C4-like [Ipomoea triloba]